MPIYGWEAPTTPTSGPLKVFQGYDNDIQWRITPVSFPIVSASRYIISLERKKMGDRNPAGWFIWRDRSGFKENCSRWGGGECCFHIGNLLTREQQNIVGIIAPFKWCDSSVGRRFSSNEDVSPQAWQQHKMQSIRPKFQIHISHQLQEATSYLYHN